ncbi:MAG: hypothetical protein ACRDLS_00545 [Solirubrobacteraceae bacterium]
MTTRRTPVVFAALGATVTLALIAALTAALLAVGITPATGAPGAQDPAGASLSAAPTHAGLNTAGSPCTRSTSTRSAAGIAVGFCVAAKAGSRAADDAFEHGYKYHPRVRQRGVEDPRAHNFAYSLDDAILKQAPIKQADGSLLYRKSGSINGKDGVYEIAVNPDTGTIFRRTWRSR